MSKLELEYWNQVSNIIMVCVISLFMMLRISLADARSNHFVNREMAHHAKALDQIYLTNKPGIIMIVQNIFKYDHFIP